MQYDLTVTVETDQPYDAMLGTLTDMVRLAQLDSLGVVSTRIVEMVDDDELLPGVRYPISVAMLTLDETADHA